MKLATAIGFRLTPPPEVPLSDFFAYLIAHNGKQESFEGLGRLLYVEEQEDTYVGLFLTIKDQKQFIQLQQEGGGEVTISVSTVEENKNITEFNFFVVHKQSRRGLYQYYHHSCGLQRFLRFLERRYKTFTSAQIAALSEALATEGKTLKEIDRATKKYKTKLGTAIVYREDALSQLIEELASVNSFSFDLDTVIYPDPKFTPVSKLLKSQGHVMRFDPKVAKASVKDAIKDLLNSNVISKGAIVGSDATGQKQRVKLQDNLDVFDSVPYEDLAKSMIKTPAELRDALAVKWLKELIQANRNEFARVAP